MRSGAGWYLLGGVLALAGIALAAALVVRFFSASSDPQQFLAPGSLSFEATVPGNYVLWYENRTVFQGTTYDLPEKLPAGIRFQAAGPDGSSLPVSAGGGGTWTSGQVSRVAVAEFVVNAPGRYRVGAEGRFEPRVFAVGREMFVPLMKTIGLAIAAAVIGLGAGIAAALYGFLRTIPAAAPAAGSAEPAPALEKLTALVYGLQAASLLVGFTLLAGVVINYLKRDEVAGTWLESHFRWQIRTFWWTLLWTVVGFATALVVVGFLVLFAAAVWLVYRVAKGWTELNERRPLSA